MEKLHIFSSRNLIVRLNRENIEDRTNSVRIPSRQKASEVILAFRSINLLIFHRNEMKYKNVCLIH